MATTIDQRIYRAWQRLQHARANGNYAAIIDELNEIDGLLDQRLDLRKATA